MIKIILTEDQNVVRNGIKSLLQNEANLQVVADVSTGLELLTLLEDGIEADILITAINFPFASGIELLEKIRQLYPYLKIIVLSALNDEQHIVQSFKAGAAGYILKSVEAAEFLFIVQQIGSTTDRFLCNALALRLLDKLIAASGGYTIPTKELIEISQREIEVLMLIAQGFTNQEVADKLFTSKRTIGSHRQNLIEKTGSRNTAALIRYAFLNKIIN